MPVLEKTFLGGEKAVTMVQNVLTASDWFTFRPDEVMIVRNTTAASIELTLRGEEPIRPVDGAADVDTSVGVTLAAIPAGAARVIPLNTLQAYLVGQVRVSGGAGAAVQILSPDSVPVKNSQIVLDYAGGKYWQAQSAIGKAQPSDFDTVHDLVRAGEARRFDGDGILRLSTPGAPDFAYDRRSGKRLGLLLEAQTTNLLFPSRDVNGVGWASTGLVRTTGAARGPDGVNNSASTIVEDTANTQRPLSQTILSGFVSGTQYVFSAIVKRRGPAARNLCMVLSGAIYGSLGTIVFDLTNVTVASQSGAVNLQAGIINLGNGWLRPWVSFQAQATGGGSVRFDVLPALSAYPTYTGDGASGFDVDFWQVEADFRPTSPILTTTAAAARNRDSCTIDLTTAKWWNPSGGTMLMHCEGIPPDGLSRVLGGVGAVPFDPNAIYVVKGSDNSVNIGAGTGGGVFGSLLGAGQYTGQPLKVAMRWTAPGNAVSACLNGGPVITDAATAILSGQTQMRFGGSPWGSVSDGNNGITVRGEYWASHLTDAQMQAITM